MRISDWSSDVCSSDLLANEIDSAACESLRQNRILRSVTPAAFDRWFDETVFSQRCFKKASLVEMSGLRERLREAVGAEVRYLEEAAIIESDVRSLTSEFILEKTGFRSEEHTSELQSLMRISYAVFCLNKKTKKHN